MGQSSDIPLAQHQSYAALPIRFSECGENWTETVHCLSCVALHYQHYPEASQTQHALMK